MAPDDATSAFANRIAKLLERVVYRRADSAEDKEKIYRLRYEAYTRENTIPHNDTGMFCNSEDEKPNTWMISLSIDGELASSVRIHVASQPEHYLPVAAAFPDFILPKLEQGKVLIDTTRQTSRLEFTRTYPFLTYLTSRAVFMACDYFGADYLVVACRAEYQPAFRRMYGGVNWAAPRPYPRLAKPQGLSGLDVRAAGDANYRRYPFLRSTPEEREALFGRSSVTSRNLYDELTSPRRERGGSERQHSTASVA